MSPASELRIPDSRPRGLIGGGYVEELRRRASSTHEHEYARLLLWARNLPHRPEADFETPGFAEHGLFRVSLLYAMKRDRRFAESARRLARIILDRPPTSRYGTGSRRLWALASYYDWCHGAISDAELDGLARVMLQYVDMLYRDELDDIYAGTSYCCGHAINQMPALLMTGAALWGEHPRGEEIARDVVRRLGEMFRCYEHFLSEGSFHMWWAYGVTYAREMPILFHIARNGLGLDWWAENPWYENYVWWILYGTREDWSWPRAGDFFGADIGWVPGSSVAGIRKSSHVHLILASIASEYSNPYAGWLLAKMRATGSRRGGLFGIEDQRIIYERRPYPVKAPGDLPLSRWFPRAGVLISREKWMEGTHILVKSTPVYLHNHSHRDAGHFAVFHRADLAVDSGAYDRYESPHWYNYYIRTIAHNTLLVVDPGEKFISRGAEYANDGGQRFVNEPHFAPLSADDLSREEFHSCDHVAAAATADYDHLHADLTPAYSPRKVSRVTRHAAVLRRAPGWEHPVLVVRDVVEAIDVGHEVKWLLHTENEPEISGPLVTAAGGDGLLRSVTILPPQARIEKVGGAGREFLVGEANFPARSIRPEIAAGAWRVEVSKSSGAQGPATRHDFLHAILAADTGADGEVRASALDLAGEAAGAVVAGAAVVFTGGVLPLDLVIPAGAGCMLCLELPPYEHMALSGPVTVDAATTESGAFWFDGDLPAGTYRLDRHH